MDLMRGGRLFLDGNDDSLKEHCNVIGVCRKLLLLEADLAFTLLLISLLAGLSRVLVYIRLLLPLFQTFRSINYPALQLRSNHLPQSINNQ